MTWPAGSTGGYASASARAPAGRQFVQYLTVGVASVVVDTGLLFLLRAGAGLALWLATTIAFTAAIVVNFTLNRTWVFQSRDRAGVRLARYLVLVAVNYVLTLVVVVGFTSLGLYYLLAKLLAVAACVSLNFVMYRAWVFR